MTRGTGDGVRVSDRRQRSRHPADVQRRIFDPFFTTKEAGEGTGLGLTICYGIIDEHNGRIWTENLPAGGVSFNIELPIGKPDEPDFYDRGVDDNSLLPAPSVSSSKVLVVDDEESIRLLLHDILRLDDHAVRIAKSGLEAFDLVRSEHFDVIITDMKMPGMDGAYLLPRGTPPRSRPGPPHHLHHRRHRQPGYARLPAARLQPRAYRSPSKSAPSETPSKPCSTSSSPPGPRFVQRRYAGSVAAPFQARGTGRRGARDRAPVSRASNGYRLDGTDEGWRNPELPDSTRSSTNEVTNDWAPSPVAQDSHSQAKTDVGRTPSGARQIGYRRPELLVRKSKGPPTTPTVLARQHEPALTFGSPKLAGPTGMHNPTPLARAREM